MGLFSRKKETSKTTSGVGLGDAVVAKSFDGIIVVDKNGVAELVNEAAAKMIGVAVPEITGLLYSSSFSFATRSGEESGAVTQALTEGKAIDTRNFDFVSVKTGRKIPVHLVITPLENGDKIIILNDIEQELREEQSRSEFISTASHEMRTPIAEISGYLGLALSPTTATIDERAKAYLEKASAASKHLGKLFQDLLDASAADSEEMKYAPEPVELTTFVKEATDAWAGAIANKGLRYVFNSSARSTGGMKMVSQLVYAYVDINYLRSVLDALMDNAVKYTKSGSITVNLRAEADKTKISVQDTGIGVATNDIAHIFQKFYRADNSDTRTVGGTGLGLYIAKRRAEEMGGLLFVESMPGQGSIFTLTLPRITADEYEKRKIAVANAGLVAQVGAETVAQPPTI
jgi:PAS domain S-box-containing protein